MGHILLHLLHTQYWKVSNLKREKGASKRLYLVYFNKAEQPT